MKLNLNRRCIVKLNPEGEKMYLEHFAQFDMTAEIPRNKKLKLHLHEVANIFGPKLFNGQNPPIETEVELLDDGF